MRQDITETIRLIEKLRQRMENLAINRGSIDDNEVLAASQELDAAINYYLWICRAPDTNR